MTLPRPLGVLGLGFFLGCAPPLVHHPQTGDGISLGLFASDPLYDYAHLIDEVADVGADALMVVVPVYLATSQASDPTLGVPSPVLLATLHQARAVGLSTTVMPIIHLQTRSHARDWRGGLTPDDPERFWSEYAATIDRVAVLAELGGAERLVVGSELSSLEPELARWQAVIAQVRSRFSGRLTYSANWDRHAEVQFWPQLDEVGVSAYHPVSFDRAGAWAAALASARETASDMPLVITEYGYPALASAAERPWDDQTGAPLDEAAQAALYDEALSALACASPTASFAWNWFGHPSDPSSLFSPRGRPAADVLARHFATAPHLRCLPGASS